MLIVHRCTNCNHPDLWANAGTTAGPHRAGIPTPTTVRRRHCAGSAATVRGGGSCHGGDGACTWGQPTTMREWWSDGTEDLEVREPGASTGTHRTCDCDDCRKFYTEMTGRSPW
jgi:hypothetical protein